MINKDKINRVLVYNQRGRMLLSAKSVSFPKDFFKIKGMDLVMLKGTDFPLISKGEPVEAIFEYLNGDRIKYNTVIDICTEYQINFHVGEGEVLKERRRSFKVMVDMSGISPFYIRGEEMFAFDDPIELHIINLNLGGVFFSSNSGFEVGDQVMLNFLDGEMKLLTEILRIQRNDNGEIEGYGCRFLDVNQSQEERLARFIFDCQVLERDRRRALEAKAKKV
ncbi:MAG: PilZ domain-containing protein [Oscillospiraceae bacterium]|nr:PilZ domain-containing protein [Oscillospiraceae bacterium]